MKKALLIFFLFIGLISAEASHIVGGELALVHIPGKSYIYRIEMIIYYDALHGDTGGDLQALVKIFSKVSNANLMTVTLNAEGPFTPDPGSYAIGTQVKYFQPDCSDGSIITNRVFYKSSEFELSPTVFNDLNGYYMAYERCCRNYSITNIYSGYPTIAPYQEIAGQILYLEFPAVIKNGEPFINSSPKLFPPLSDYGCPFRSYFVDFSGVDADGDSLVYSLVTPLNSKERFAALPVGGANPGPYDSVIWKPGFSNTNMMKGSPDLRISSDGLLTVTPTTPGLFVFSVRCAEYRDGEKIGEVRRDFQMLVQNSCPDAEPPVIVGKAPGDSDFGTSNEINLTIGADATADDRCFEVRVSDPDALKFDDGFSEKIKLKAIPIGFRKNISEVLPQISTGTISNNGTATFKICLPTCPYVPGGDFKIAIVSFDDACTLPLSDTLYINVAMDYPTNSKVQFDNSGGSTEITETLNQQDFPKSWNLKADDADNDILDYKLIPVDFNLQDVGMTFPLPLEGKLTGSIAKTLVWNPSCDILSFINQSEYLLYFIVDDEDVCGVNSSDTTVLNLGIFIPENQPPDLTAYSENPNQPIVNGALNATLRDPISLTLLATDDDNIPADVLNIELIGYSGNVEPKGYVFQPKTGASPLQTSFTWNPDCSIFIDDVYENTFTFSFRVSDQRCYNPKVDTVTVSMLIQDVDGGDGDFLPPNFFTPNNDGKNDFFAMVKEISPGVYENILPYDNCVGEFVGISIFDRWGKQIYQNGNRDFRWYGNNTPVGVYYYFLRYTNKEYKGTVTVRY